MCIYLQNDPIAHEISKQLEISDGKIEIGTTNSLIALLNNFCTISVLTINIVLL